MRKKQKVEAERRHDKKEEEAELALERTARSRFTSEVCIGAASSILRRHIARRLLNESTLSDFVVNTFLPPTAGEEGAQQGRFSAREEGGRILGAVRGAWPRRRRRPGRTS